MVPIRIFCTRNDRRNAEKALLQQGERRVKISRHIVVYAQVGDDVAIPISFVDRGGDLSNILGVSIDQEENDMYTTAVQSRFSTVPTEYLPSE